MNFSLKTDENFKLTKKQIEDDIDSLIDSSKINLTIKIQNEIKDKKILSETLEMIYKDLEEKRINIKKYFLSQLETITIESYKNALKTFNKG